MNKTLLFLFIIFWQIHLFAQNHYCGSEMVNLGPSGLKKMAVAYARPVSMHARTAEMDTVPITAFIINSASSGIGILNQELIQEEIDKTNRIYNSSGIHFLLCGSVRVIPGEFSYNTVTGDILNSINHVPNTINIFFVDDLQLSFDQALCGYARFPFLGEQKSRYVMMNKSCSTDGATLIHELGHFYGLFHTHEIFQGLEFVDGSNCESAGDFLCDTPADPNLGLPGRMSGCTYVGQFVDPNGDPYAPPVNNFMSYAPSNCVRFFTSAQKEIIRSVHENENAYLVQRCDFYPDFAVSAEIENLQIRSDENFEVQYHFTNLHVDREYEVQLKISLLEDPEEVGLLLLKESVVIPEGESEFTLTFPIDFPISTSSGEYLLQISIDADFEVIELTENNNKASITIDVDNSTLTDQILFSNPVKDELKIFIRDAQANGDLLVRIYTPDGRLMLESEGYKDQEEYFEILDVSPFQAGLYILQILELEFRGKDIGESYVFKFFKI